MRGKKLSATTGRINNSLSLSFIPNQDLSHSSCRLEIFPNFGHQYVFTMKFGTKAVHAGVEPDPSTGAIMTPIFQTSTYVQESPSKHKGYAYARGANPTRNELQKSLTALENGKFA